ncbi:hypothetical protein A0J61_11291, partial [Choanephora cucurbitarum]
MVKQYQYSMAIVGYFGKPSLFIIFTANPRWIEIQRELLPGQNAPDRPDLVARVFDLKVKNVGLPHLHLLLFLDSSHAIHSADEIDRTISAEIPSKESDPELYKIVTKNMVHGPCGNLNTKSPCMVKDANRNLKCSKRFPKTFTEQTVISDDGYPLYKRARSTDLNSRYSIRDPLGQGNGSIVIDDRWIVPYNPYLSKKFKAHINVECCQSVKAIKYINKYVYKSSDRTTLKLSDTENEGGRHLQVCFSEDATSSELQHTLANSRSMLMAYFHYYQNNSTAQKDLYQDFSQYFVWNKKDKVCKHRQRGFAIGRLDQSFFEELQTVDGAQCETFMQACLKLHLIEDDQELSHCFDEAVMFSTGSSLRNLFVTALTFGQLLYLALLWEELCDVVYDDLAHKLQTLFPDQLHEKYTVTDDSLFYKGRSEWDYGLFLLDEKLGHLGSSLETCQMPSYKNDWTNDL